MFFSSSSGGRESVTLRRRMTSSSGHVMTPRKCFVAKFVLVLLLLTFQHGECLYFTETQYNVAIPSSLSKNDDVIEIHVHSTPSVGHPKATGAKIECSVTKTTDARGREIKHRKPFHVTSSVANATIRIFVANPVDAWQISDRTTYHLQIGCHDETNDVRNHCNVTVNVIRHQGNGNGLEHTSLCRQSRNFQLAEGVEDVVIGRLWCASSALCPQNSTADDCRLTVIGTETLRDYSSHVSIDASGQLTADRSFDHEGVKQLTLTYLCPSAVSSNHHGHCSATLTILDVDDQGPWFLLMNSPSLKYLSFEKNLLLDDAENVTKLTTITVMDNDLPTSNRYRAYLDNDYGGMFYVQEPYFDPILPRFISTDVMFRRSKKGLSSAAHLSLFNVVIHITDESFIPSFNQHDNNSAVFDIAVQFPARWKQTIMNSTFANVSISSSASRYSKVYAMGYANASLYRIVTVCESSHNDVSDMFAVTSRDGIVYVSNPTLMRDFVGQSAVVIVSACRSNVADDCSSVLNITVNIRNATRHVTDDAKVVSCAIYSSQSSCEGAFAVGLGSPEGVCAWRKSTDGANQSSYETCSPSLTSCPDFHCDELEKNVTELCPQDCTTNTPISEYAALNGKYVPPRGILEAKGPCWCNGNCYCGKVPAYFSVNETVRDLNGSQTTESGGSGEMAPGMEEGCGVTCRLTLFIGLSCALVLTLTIVVWKCIYYKRKMRRMRGHGSGIVPSDYVITSGSITTDYTDYTSGHLLDLNHQNILDIQSDPKWEFNRGYVKIESVLGEGEFGKVVKAQAWNIQGIAGQMTVAIKMLKECASGVEYRDLLSELNLLKQVNHRNVIKLLGVCSRHGPLYVIVEYCEHGSLRSFLRSVRGKKEYLETRTFLNTISEIQTGTMEKTSKVNLEVKDLADEGVSVQDLLSFSWQIAKGMEYLSGMKVVHRDLAARNILLASGKVIKISDFGLSRDVYEGDAYLKTSKGPLPVKWMAPESLYDHICTTKSDIWSYGVVLWEIYTLGANPYPGTPAERLYQLLKTGYRMTKPASCSDELFSVMLHCWMDDPEKRPTFKELGDIFEQFLSLDKEYLDLNACEGVLQDERDTVTSSNDSRYTSENDQQRSKPPDAGHYQVPRPLTESDHEHDDRPKNTMVNGIGLAGVQSSDLSGKTSCVVIPLQTSQDAIFTGHVVRGQTTLANKDNPRVEGGGNGETEEEGESNALLASSTHF